ncbi:hypothetical protein L210DRAFT_3537852 [Boletus edulis BED1]|uniref:Uncharacterized protein n=1 Tax=Boletus edulis BED1 TaxID=1328754 RepID=A0AAD4GFQ8_BOLED|nr:hypothetical protein L210DRAFT_3537852 [Boletus edulis BED1]
MLQDPPVSVGLRRLRVYSEFELAMSTGKTIFLVYLLVELLGRRQKVAVQYPTIQGYAIFTDTVAFYPVTDVTPLKSGDRVWALSDSSEKNQSLPRIFYHNLNYTLPIQATSPKKDRWHDWSKQACADRKPRVCDNLSPFKLDLTG